MEPKQQPPYPLRMPPELRLKLEQEAESARRSLNAEIIDRLQMSVAGERPSALVINTLALAMARAEKGAAMSTLRAQADLMDAARVSRALVAAVEALQGAGIRAMEGDPAFAAAYSLARSFVSDAISFANSDRIDVNLRNAKQREEELLDSERRILAAVAELRDDVPPERAITFKGSSGKARRISVVTKTSRKPKP